MIGKSKALPRTLALLFALALLLGCIASPAMAAETPVADMLDVDFSGGKVIDHSPKARTFINNSIEADNIVWNSTLGKYVGEINGRNANVWKTAWPAADWAAINKNITMETMFRLDNPVTGSWMAIFGGMQSAGIGFDLYAGDANHAQLDISAHIGGSYRDPRSGNIIEFGKWYHAVATYDGAVVKLYVNGELISSVAYAGTITTPGTGAQWFVVGGDTTGSNTVEAPLDGAIALGRVYSRALSAEEIAGLAAAAMPEEDEPKEEYTAPLTRTYNSELNEDGSVTVTASFKNSAASVSGKAVASLGILGDAIITYGLPENTVIVAPGETVSVNWTVKALSGSARLIVLSEVNGTVTEERVGKVASKSIGWISGDIHDHSRYSDGSGTIAENFVVAGVAGMDYINISDHDNSRGWGDAQIEGPKNGIIPIWGNEYSGYGHTVFMNVNREFNYNNGVLPKAAVANLKADTNGRGLAYAAHPYDGTVEADPWAKNDSWNAAIDGIEVWNGWYASNYPANAQARVQWDKMNKEGRHLYGIADTDTHSAAGMGAVYTTVYAEEYNVDGIIDAYLQGHMYGSNGPVIDFKLGQAMMGDDYKVPAEGRTVSLSISGYYVEDLARLLVIKNGELFYTKEINAKSFTDNVPVFVKPDDFIRIEVEGKETDRKKLTNGSYSTAAFFTSAPFAFSNPIFFVEDDTAITDPKVSFGVISDTHIGGTGHGSGTNGQRDMLNNVLDWYSAQGVDALAMVGDLTDSASSAQFNTLKACIDEHLAPSVQRLASMGNHDHTGILGGNSNNFSTATGVDPNAHYIINGYHFITLSPGNSGSANNNPRAGAIAAMSASTGIGNSGTSTYNYVANWAEQQIQTAIADDPAKPVFVFFHHPLRYSFYVSEEWYGSGLGDGNNTFFSKYPQVVSFSGHIHSPNNDPRSIWQDGGFTAVNTVTTYYYEMESGFIGNNANFSGTSTYPAPDRTAAQGMVVEAEGSSVTIKNYDFKASSWMEQVWSFDVSEPLTYTKARAKEAVKPVFGEGAKISAAHVNDTTVSVTFDQATIPGANKIQDIVHSYRYEVYNDSTGMLLRSAKQWSDFMYTDTQPAYTQNINGLTLGETYELRLYAVSSFGQTSEEYLSVLFKAGTGEVEKTYTVTFMDWDGTVIDEQSVAYGFAATAPNDPYRQDWIFTGWDADLLEISADLTVRALYDPTIIGLSAEAYVSGRNGNKNDLTITVTEFWSDGAEIPFTKTFSINNNAANIYDVGCYKVYVETKGNTQIRYCYIVDGNFKIPVNQNGQGQNGQGQNNDSQGDDSLGYGKGNQNQQ